MNLFLIISLSNNLSKLDIIGIIFGHLMFGIALTVFLDWSWLKNLMNEDDKNKMLKYYNWKDLLVDSGILAIVFGVFFILLSKFI